MTGEGNRGVGLRTVYGEAIRSVRKWKSRVEKDDVHRLIMHSLNMLLAATHRTCSWSY